ncbi:DUF5995 family protein [Arenibacter certesii]|uniref:Uncharacterized protein n=1 Tax=Arenibacter certesii TaxID=228955 RepID=A0A918MQK7_9FLAO|nr:DUF5995 family protein [Arenibacter certesii]GGW44416.1 hypothetical protein GCM10007383_31070 [Arenibacter certesii]
MNSPTTIQEVLNELDIIIEDAIASNDRLGLFAYVYRRTTSEIFKEIQLQNFEDNPRMEKMDVVFANLYLNAYKNYKINNSVPKAWEFAFTNKNEPLTIIQHILLGMNAHINLDLAIATSTSMNGIELAEIKNDFNKINDILFSIVNEFQDRLSSVSYMLFLLDMIGENSDEKIIDFSMRKAREQAWNSTNLLWALGSDKQGDTINGIDSMVLQLSKVIKSPKSRLVRFILKTIGKFEKNEVGAVISKLQEN